MKKKRPEIWILAFLAVHDQKSYTWSGKNDFFGIAYYYPTTLVISDDPEKIIHSELFVTKNWPEIDKNEKLTFFKKSS